MTFLPLDHLIFGNGHGMATPYCDGAFYWLGGELYHWSGWFGAQLTSYQWTHPRPGERRILSGVTFRPFRSERSWGRVRVAWSAERVPSGLEEANAWLRALKRHFGEGYHAFSFRPPAPQGCAQSPSPNQAGSP